MKKLFALLIATPLLVAIAKENDTSVSSMPGLVKKDLMTAAFAPEKTVSRVELKEVVLEPMGKVPLHRHPIPVLSVIKEGAIYFQIEGQPAQHLKPGDVCYEPAGARVAHFDNESTTPAKFVALYMMGKDDHELVERLTQTTPLATSGPTRKDLMTATMTPEKVIARTEITELTLVPKRQGPLHLHPIPVLTVIEEGNITFQIDGQPVQHLKAGDVFYEPTNVRIAHLDNEGDTPAKLAVFFMLGKDDHELVQRLEQ